MVEYNKLVAENRWTPKYLLGFIPNDHSLAETPDSEPFILLEKAKNIKLNTQSRAENSSEETKFSKKFETHSSFEEFVYLLS